MFDKTDPDELEYQREKIEEAMETMPKEYVDRMIEKEYSGWMIDAILDMKQKFCRHRFYSDFDDVFEWLMQRTYIDENDIRKMTAGFIKDMTSVNGDMITNSLYDEYRRELDARIEKELEDEE